MSRCPTKLHVVMAATVLAAHPAHGNDNGLAPTPPMGWRSWNEYGANVDQPLIERIMDGMTNRSRTDHLGVPTSLCDLGYCDVGLDDNWQDCGSTRAAQGMHYHDPDGNPIVNVERFPDLRRMTDHAHSLGLTAGFYGNNCICADKCRNDTECDMQIRGDVRAFVRYNFDSWKLDGCGGENDLAAFDRYLREEEAGRPIMVESCHWGVPKYDPDRSLPPSEGCPFNFYRSSGDISLSYGSVLANLASVERYRAANLSYPGCWAYPDMLEVGMRRRGDGKEGDGTTTALGPIGLTNAEARSHFGAWSIVSSPLVLGHDVNDDVVTDDIWDVISNREAILVNQAYAGDSGGVYERSADMVELLLDVPGGGHGGGGAQASIGSASRQNRRIQYDHEHEHEHVVPSLLLIPAVEVVPSYQYLSKPFGGSKVAVLLMNSGSETATLEAKFADIPGLMVGCCRHNADNNCRRCRCSVRDVWKHRDVGVFEGSWSGSVDSHDAAFLVLEAESTATAT